MVSFQRLRFLINRYDSYWWVAIVSWLKYLILAIYQWDFFTQHLMKHAVDLPLDSSVLFYIHQVISNGFSLSLYIYIYINFDNILYICIYIMINKRICISIYIYQITWVLVYDHWFHAIFTDQSSGRKRTFFFFCLMIVIIKDKYLCY